MKVLGFVAVTVLALLAVIAVWAFVNGNINAML